MNNWIRHNIFKLIIIAGVLVFFLPGSTNQVAAQKGAQALAAPANVPTDQIILQYKSSSQAFQNPAQPDQMGRLNNVAGLVFSYLRRMSGNADVIKLPASLPLDQVQKIADLLATLPEVQYAVPDQRRFAVLSPNDTYYVAGDQWDMNDPTGGIDAPAAWDITTGTSGVVVADADTGLTNHVDLAGRMVSGSVATSGYDFVSNVTIANDGDGWDSNPSDPGDWVTSAESKNKSSVLYGCPVSNSSWHGTHTAGTIGAASNNALGVAGINWVSKLLIVRVLGKCGGYDSDIIDGIEWAAGLPVSTVPTNANPAKVINLSLGGTGACSSAWQNAINAINAAGAVVVAAAGNSSSNVSGFTPASCNGVIAVAATGRTGSLSYYSNYGSGVEISAPGGDDKVDTGVLSTLNTGTTVPVADTYAYYEGTSMATPHVTSVVSLLFSVNPSLTPAQVLSILQSTARPFPAGSTCLGTYKNECGAGILDAGAAVRAAMPPVTFNKTSPANGATNQAYNPTLSWGSASAATSYDYCIDTTNNSTCDGSWVNTGSNTSVALSGLTPGATYYWQVRYTNAGVSPQADNYAWWSFTTTPCYALTITVTPSGAGTVNADTPPNCSSGTLYNSGTVVNLTAKPASPANFGSWSGGGCSGTGTCTVTMNAAISVTATFKKRVHDDYDGDGKTDPAKFVTSAGALWYLASSNATWQGVYMGPGTYTYVNAADYDGDGKTDPAEFISSSNALWYLASSTGTWQGLYMGPGTYTLVKGSDYDGDGKTDPALFVSGANALWYRASGTGTWTGVYMGPGSYQMVPGSDFDGDGKTDPALFVTGSNTLWYLGSSTGTWTGVYLGPGSYNYVAGSDFDGDGKTDPAEFLASTNTLWYLASSTGTWTGVYMGTGTLTYVAGCDFDGDGKTDPAVYIASTETLTWMNSSTSTWSSVNMGTGTFTVVNGL